MPAHIAVRPDAVPWGSPPQGMVIGTPSIEAGSPLKYALLQGDPMKPGEPFTIRLGCADGHKTAPHWHPTDENIVVLSGTFALTTGDVFDAGALGTAHDLPAGSYGFMPAHMHHFGQCKGETDLLVYGIGPFQIHFLSAPESATRKP